MKIPEKYKNIVNLARKMGLNYAFMDEYDCVSPCIDFGVEFIDTESFEVPCSFDVNEMLIVHFPDVKDDDDGSSYNEYFTNMEILRDELKPQYIAFDKQPYAVKLMVWCEWSR